MVIEFFGLYSPLTREEADLLAKFVVGEDSQLHIYRTVTGKNVFVLNNHIGCEVNKAKAYFYLCIANANELTEAGMRIVKDEIMGKFLSA